MSCGTLSVQNNKTHPLGRLNNNGRKLIPSVNQIGALARRCGLFLRTPRKILPAHLLASLLAAIALGERSARAIALELGICTSLAWPQGPFSMMNALGMEESARLVSLVVEKGYYRMPQRFLGGVPEPWML